jgi:hypothetical protein
MWLNVSACREETLEGKEVAGGAWVMTLKSRSLKTEWGLAVIPELGRGADGSFGYASIPIELQRNAAET